MKKEYIKPDVTVVEACMVDMLCVSIEMYGDNDDLNEDDFFDSNLMDIL